MEAKTIDIFPIFTILENKPKIVVPGCMQKPTFVNQSMDSVAGPDKLRLGQLRAGEDLGGREESDQAVHQRRGRAGVRLHLQQSIARRLCSHE